MNRVHTGSEYRMAQNAPGNRDHMTCGQAAWPKGLLVLALAIGVSVGLGQPIAGPTSQPESPVPTWNDVCCVMESGDTVRWAVGDSGKVLKMVNGDTAVGYVIGRGQYDFCGVSFADVNHGWIVGNKRDEPNRGSGVVLSTRRGGNEARDWVWSCPVIRPDINVPFLKVQALSSRHVWVTCGDGYMLYTNDGGARWAVTAKRPRPAEPRTSGSDNEK